MSSTIIRFTSTELRALEFGMRMSGDHARLPKLYAKIAEAKASAAHKKVASNAK